MQAKELLLDATAEKAKAIIKMIGEILPKLLAVKNRLQGGRGGRSEAANQETGGEVNLHQWE